MNGFFGDFLSYLENLVLSTGELLLVGDFNFYVDDSEDHDAARFLSLLATFDLKQNVFGSTHKSGHTLDLIITCDSESLVRNIDIKNAIISDHCAVHFKLDLEKQNYAQKTISFWSWKSVDLTAFKQDIPYIGLFWHMEILADFIKNGCMKF